MTPFGTAGLLFSMLSIFSPPPSTVQYVTLCNVPFCSAPHICTALLKRPESVCAAPPPVTKAIQAHGNGAAVRVRCCGMIVETVKQERWPLCNLFLSLTPPTALSQSCPFVEAIFSIFKVAGLVVKALLPVLLSLFLLLCSVPPPLPPPFKTASLNSLNLLPLFYESLPLNWIPALSCHAVSGGYI